MKVRPLCTAAVLLILLLSLLQMIGVMNYDAPQAQAERLFGEGKEQSIAGRVYRRTKREYAIQYDLKDTYLQGEDGWIPLAVHISVYSSGEGIHKIGADILARGTPKPTKLPTNPGQFNSRAYYARENIYFTMSVSDTEALTKGGGLLEYLNLINARASGQLGNMLDADTASVLSALLLGDKSGLSQETKFDYQTAGLLHMLTISGLHLTLIGSLIFGLLTRLRLPRVPSALLAVLCLVLFGLFTGSTTSVLRAFIMFVLHLGARLTRRSYDIASALSLSLILLLAENRMNINYSGLWLSFTSVAGIGILYPAWSRILEGDRPRRRPAGRMQSLMKYRKKLADGLLGGCVITLTTLPVVAWCFFEVPLLGIFVNLLLLPFLPVIMVSGAAGLLVSAGSVWAGKILLLPAAGLLGVYDRLLGLLGRLPFATFVSGQPEVWQIALYYAGFLILTVFLYLKRTGACWKIHSHDLQSPLRGIFSPNSVGVAHYAAFIRTKSPTKWVPHLAESNFQTRPRACWKIHSRNLQTRLGEEAVVPRAVRGAAVSVLMLLPIFLLWRSHPELSITALDVGQGDGICVQSGKTAFLIDGGSSSQKQVGRYILLPYLKSQGISMLEGAVLTHPDEDHKNGIVQLLEMKADGETNFRIRNLFLPAWMKGGAEAADLSALAVRAGTAVQYLRKGDEITVEAQPAGKVMRRLRLLFGGKGEEAGKESLRIRALHPDGADYTNETNAGSVTLSLHYGRMSALLTGDLEGSAEDALLPDLAACDYLKVGHHGSKNATSEAFLAATSPHLAVISCGADNSYGHPHPELLGRLTDAKSNVWQTKDAGAVTVTYRDGKILATGYVNNTP